MLPHNFGNFATVHYFYQSSVLWGCQKFTIPGVSLAIFEPHGYPAEIVAIYETGDVHQFANCKKLPEGYPENGDVHQFANKLPEGSSGFFCFLTIFDHGISADAPSVDEVSLQNPDEIGERLLTSLKPFFDRMIGARGRKHRNTCGIFLAYRW